MFISLAFTYYSTNLINSSFLIYIYSDLFLFITFLIFLFYSYNSSIIYLNWYYFISSILIYVFSLFILIFLFVTSIDFKGVCDYLSLLLNPFKPIELFNKYFSSSYFPYLRFVFNLILDLLGVILSVDRRLELRLVSSLFFFNYLRGIRRT
jgi:hypothetical protein